MNLIRDVLDNQIVDRDQYKLGKVDGIVLELRDDQPPRLAYLEVGGPTLARRLHPRLGRWAATFGCRWGINGGEPFRIPWRLVRDVGIDVEVDLVAEDTPVLGWEHWLREHIIGRIPGAG
jgi:sporulation protein YlmC with PRC-barrel domain